MPEVAERQYLEVIVDCDGCEGKGQVTRPETRITNAAMPFHVANHAMNLDADRKPIGANCDCPRRTRHKTSKCIVCLGEGTRLRKFTIPVAGDKVEVVDKKLLASIFGDEVPEEPGKVFDMQMPEEHHLELRTGYGIRVTWDRLTNKHTIPKGQQVDLWTFDLSELKLAK